jgi:hypothetical protein
MLKATPVGAGDVLRRAPLGFNGCVLYRKWASMELVYPPNFAVF